MNCEVEWRLSLREGNTMFKVIMRNGKLEKQ